MKLNCCIAMGWAPKIKSALANTNRGGRDIGNGGVRVVDVVVMSRVIGLTFLQTNRQQKIEGQLKAKKQGAAKFAREMSLIEKTMREKEVELVKKKPLYIKAKERTLHVVKRLEASK